MSPQEAAQVLAVFGAAFRTNVSEEDMQLWYSSTLHDCPADIAGEVAKRIVAADDWFPNPARFNGLRRSIERGRAQPHQALPAPVVSDNERDRVKQIIASTRARLHGQQEAS